jgi:hypothetical protein
MSGRRVLNQQIWVESSEGQPEQLELFVAPNGVVRAVPLPKDEGIDQDGATFPLSYAEMTAGNDQA